MQKISLLTPNNNPVRSRPETTGIALAEWGSNVIKEDSRECNKRLGFRKYFCPRRGWYMDEPCYFENKRECDNFKLICGVL